MKPKKSPPLHQQARREGLTGADSKELRLYREFLRALGSNAAKYLRIYGKDKP